MATTKVKEECIYTDSRLEPYEGTNEFKIGTSMCTGCGIRVDSVTGEPVEGVACPVQTRVANTVNAETAQEAIVQIQTTVDAKVEAAMKEERARVEAETKAQVEMAQTAALAAKAEAQAEIAAIKEVAAKELKALKDQFEDDLEEIGKKHAAELKAATSAKPENPKS